MQKVSAAILFLLANGFGQVQTASSPTGASANPVAANASVAKAEISGQVVDSANGQPLKKTWVTARQAERGGRNSPTTVTDSEGHFRLKDLDAGRYILSAQRNGYVNQTYGQKNLGDKGTTISLDPGQKITDITFRLLQGGVITGRVLDEDSESISHAQVQALQFRYLQGRRRLVPLGAAMTDDRGEYRIFGVRPGQVYIRASVRGIGMYSDPGESGDPNAPSESTSYPPVFYPNVLDASQASTLAVRGGDELHVDFAMSPQRSYTVSGRLVAGVQGTTGRGAWLMLTKRGEGEFTFGPTLNTTVREDNTFTFNQVLPGSYNLLAQQQDGQASASAKAEVDVHEGDIQGLVVSLSAKVDVNGRLTFEGNSAAKPTAVRISLTPEDLQDFMRGSYGQCKDDGTFSFQVLPEERYKISVFGAPPEMYLRSASAGRDDVLEKGFSASSSRTLDLTFAAGAKVTGNINTPDGKGEPGVTVVLVPERKLAGLADQFRTATTDQNGRYQLQGVRPGSYRVYAFEHVEPGAYEDEEWLKAFADQSQTLKVSEGAQQSLDMKPIPSGAESQP